jgi:hypothetical protein
MKYFKHVNVDSESEKVVSKKLLDYVNSNGYSDKGFWTNVNTHDVLNKVPELAELYKPIGINIKRIAFVTAKEKVGTIHIDDPKTAPAIRINIPVLNCEQTSTNFYVSGKPANETRLPSGIYYYKWDEKDCTLVASTCISRSTLIRTNELHQVCIHTDNMPRITCTIEFYEDLEHLMN